MAKRFQKGSGCYKCISCGKLTRETGSCESHVDLCLACWDEAGLENEHSDGMHPDGGVEGCPKCKAEGTAKEFERGTRVRCVQSGLVGKVVSDRLELDGYPHHCRVVELDEGFWSDSIQGPQRHYTKALVVAEDGLERTG